MGVIHKYARDVSYKLPVYGAAADIKKGAFMKRGATPATDNGMLIKASGSSATPDIIGRMNEMLDYSEDGETLINGTAQVTKEILLAHNWKIFRLEYADSTSDDVACTQAVTSTAMTLTSLEDNIDAAFLYVVRGTGAGQTNYLTASASGSCTLKAAFGTSLDTTSNLIKILPRFHLLGALDSDGIKLTSQAAAGAIKIVVIDTYIERNGKVDQISPVDHAALTGLNNYRSVRFWADVAIRDTAVYSVD